MVLQLGPHPARGGSSESLVKGLGFRVKGIRTSSGVGLMRGRYVLGPTGFQ